jgi:hypothetical protein
MMDEWNRNGWLETDHNPVARGTTKRTDARRERAERRRRAIDDMLDRALEDTFPGSDPVAATQPPHSIHDKRPG